MTSHAYPEQDSQGAARARGRAVEILRYQLPALQLHAAKADWDVLHRHLFPGDHDEQAAVLLCGQVANGPCTRLLVRHVVLAEDVVDYLPGNRGYRHLTGEFVTHQVRRSKDEGLVYLAVHNHRGSTSVGFSGPDLASHERPYPTLLGVTKQPVGALVLADNAVAGDRRHDAGPYRCQPDRLPVPRPGFAG